MSALLPSEQKILNKLLYEAVVKNEPEAVKRYVQKGANVNCSSDDSLNMPLLHKAYRMTIFPREVIAFLLGQGADINIKDAGGNTIVMCMVKGGQIGKLEHLLAHGANTRIADSGGILPLEAACKLEVGRNQAVIDLLVSCLPDTAAEKNKKENFVDITLKKPVVVFKPPTFKKPSKKGFDL